LKEPLFKKGASMQLRKPLVVLVHAFIGWLLCAATMGIGMATTTLRTTLIIHAIGAPVYFAVVSIFYFKRHSYTRPLQTAVIFVIFVMVIDFFVVALLINRSLEMFTSALGTWIPFALIFISTLATGLFLYRTKTKEKTS
jgi:hypothetical protein